VLDISRVHTSRREIKVPGTGSHAWRWGRDDGIGGANAHAAAFQPLFSGFFFPHCHSGVCAIITMRGRGGERVGDLEVGCWVIIP